MLLYELSVELRSPSPVSLERINIRVIDPFTIKPLDHKTIIDNARVTRGRIITVEDHYYEGEQNKKYIKIAASHSFDQNDGS